MYAPHERHHNDRPRPMTTGIFHFLHRSVMNFLIADYNSEGSKHQEKRYIPQGYGPAQKFPAVGGSYRVASAKPYNQ